MKILVINTGSSSIKYKLFDMDDEHVLASGLIEKIGETGSQVIHTITKRGARPLRHARHVDIPDHRRGLNLIVETLCHGDDRVVGHISEISAVGHRVVHGGEAFNDSVIIDEEVIGGIESHIPLAPLHNPANLTGISVARSVFSAAPHVAVFDTAYHQSIPREAFLYALPYRLYESAAVRRYGFHGTSHRFVAEQAARFLGHPLDGLNLITIHLGNGASMTAVKDGRSVDTTMGMTPLEGLIMGTRCGDLDPAVPSYLMRHLGMSVDDVEDLLNRQSGLKGLCGTNDMREVLEKAREGNEVARSAVKMYTYRVKKYIGAFFAVLERLDGLVFTGGIGERAPEIRRRCCEGLTRLGIEIDPAANEEITEGLGRIEGPSSQIPVLVVPTNEELQIARETLQVVGSSQGL